MRKAPAFGLRLADDGRGVVVCAAEQALLAVMLGWRRSGLTCAQISALLKHSRRVLNPRTGLHFTASQVRSALASARGRARASAA